MDDYQHMGTGRVPLMLAVDAANEAIGNIAAAGQNGDGSAPDLEPQSGERVPTAAENDRALAELQKMMGGLRG